MTPNFEAFLATIRHSEGTDLAPDPYAVCFGYKFTITDFSNHPAVLGVWHGEPLDFLGPEYVGKVSTAAGAYQLIKPTWLGCESALGLPDFSAESQDLAAIHLIDQAGALSSVESGDLSQAIHLCHGIWASLPGSQSGQPQKALADLQNAFTLAGGVLAV